MVKYVILLGGAVVRDGTMIDIRRRRCDRHGCLSLRRLVAQHGPDAAVAHPRPALLPDARATVPNAGGGLTWCMFQ